MMTGYPVRLLNLGIIPAAQTQSVYHALARSMTESSPDTLVICRPATPYLCLGYHQIFDSVFDRAECEKRSLPIMRRRVGGGATYLDSNQIFYQCIFHHTRVPVMFQKMYAQMLAAPVASLRKLGLNADLHSVNEVEANGKRIAGIGGGRIGDACVVVGNLLLDFDYEAMSEVWHVPWESYRELAAQALSERVTTLRREVGNVDIGEMTESLIEEYERELGRPLKVGALTCEEEQLSESIGKKMTAPGYLNLHSERRTAALPPLKISADVYIHSARLSLDESEVFTSFRVENEAIRMAHLHSIPAQDWSAVESKLIGVAVSDWEREFRDTISSARPR